MEDQIKVLFNHGTTSIFRKPILFTRLDLTKKMGTSGKRKIRVVTDYGMINEKTKNDKYLIPQIEEI